jgi:hypothetical protein
MQQKEYWKFKKVPKQDFGSTRFTKLENTGSEARVSTHTPKPTV